MAKFLITFSENDYEYTGTLEVDCREVLLSRNDNCVFYADGIPIKIDEPIIEITDKDGQLITQTI